MQFVDGSSPCPPQFLSDDDDRIKTDGTVNPDFEAWLERGPAGSGGWSIARPDRLCEWLHRSPGPKQLAKLGWEYPWTVCRSASQTHVAPLRRDLRRTTNADRSTGRDFLLASRPLPTGLALACSSPVPESESLDVILENVSSYYKEEVIHSARSHHEPITYRNLEALLLVRLKLVTSVSWLKHVRRKLSMFRYHNLLRIPLLVSVKCYWSIVPVS